MPLMHENPAPKPAKVIEDVLPRIQPKEFKSCLVTTGEVAIGSLVQFISGTDYHTTYYTQVLGRDDAPAQYDLNQTAEYQQYYKVDKFILRLQGSMSNSFDNSTNQLTISGTALLMPGIICNIGDVFIGDIGDGRLALFGVEDTSPLTYRDGAVYSIDFKMIDYLSAEIISDLDQKTVTNYVFDKTSLDGGLAPIVEASEYEYKLEVEALWSKLLTRYLNDFYSSEYSTLLVPGQAYTRVYDPFATKAFLSITNVKDDPRIASVQRYNIGDYKLDKQLSMWEMLIRRDADLKDQVFREFKLVSTSQFHYNPAMKSIRFTGIEFVVIGKLAADHINASITLNAGEGLPLNIPSYDGVQMSSLGDGNSYVLGEAFYDSNITDTMPMAEKLINRLLNGGKINYSELIEFHEHVKKLPAVHRYYLQLLLLIVIKLETNRACEC